jgi:hypothetical protein
MQLSYSQKTCRGELARERCMTSAFAAAGTKSGHVITTTMSHNFDHDHCSDEAHVHDHDHAHDSLGLGPQNNLFPQVDIQNVRVLNAAGDAASGDGSVVIKPWDRRLDESEVW